MGKTFKEQSLPYYTNARPEDQVEVYKFDSDWSEVRFVGDVVSYKIHWVVVETKEGTETKVPVLATDPEDGIDPYTQIPNEMSTSQHWWCNAFIRSKKNKLKVVRLPKTVVNKLSSLGALNKHKNKKGEEVAYDLSHPKFGVDIHIRFDKSAPFSAMYSVQRGEISPLTKKERKTDLFDLSNLYTKRPYDAACKHAEELAAKAVGAEKPKKKKKKKKKSPSDEIPF